MAPTYECPYCGRPHTAKSWDNCTLGLLKALHGKDVAYVPLGEPKSEESWYVCPSCEHEIHGAELRLNRRKAV